MMVPYLHITGGDNLLFKSWHPSSHGAIAGACIGLVALALLERLLNGIRNRLEGYWSRRSGTLRRTYELPLTVFL
jgi:copper transporter 1